MPVFFNPETQNREVWDECPKGYITEEEGLSRMAGDSIVPLDAPDTPGMQVAKLKDQLAALDAEYFTPRMQADLAGGDEEARRFAQERYAEHEKKAAPIRERL